jgi:hypothetical protein
MRSFAPNDNATIVATFDGQTPDPRAYEAEMRAYEASREFREIRATMSERSSVCG